MIYNDKKISFFHPYAGAPLAAAMMDEVIAHGYTKFVACGGAGVLDKEIQTGKIIIPYSAVRDEGTSYHYVEPSREIEIPEFVISKLKANLEKNGIPYIVAKTWTTDAFYRETEKRRDLRKKRDALLWRWNALRLQQWPGTEMCFSVNICTEETI
ncbi:MAG: nucleoside phosphorylase [Fibrobacter sp.]|nr:nucleoside phosphorylase [Fibrobacter sp.]